MPKTISCSFYSVKVKSVVKVTGVFHFDFLQHKYFYSLDIDCVFLYFWYFHSGFFMHNKRWVETHLQFPCFCHSNENNEVSEIKTWCLLAQTDVSKCQHHSVRQRSLFSFSVNVKYMFKQHMRTTVDSVQFSSVSAEVSLLKLGASTSWTVWWSVERRGKWRGDTGDSQIYSHMLISAFIHLHLYFPNLTARFLIVALKGNSPETFCHCLKPYSCDISCKLICVDWFFVLGALFIYSIIVLL